MQSVNDLFKRPNACRSRTSEHERCIVDDASQRDSPLLQRAHYYSGHMEDSYSGSPESARDGRNLASPRMKASTNPTGSACAEKAGGVGYGGDIEQLRVMSNLVPRVCLRVCFHSLHNCEAFDFRGRSPLACMTSLACFDRKPSRVHASATAWQRTLMSVQENTLTASQARLAFIQPKRG